MLTTLAPVLPLVGTEASESNVLERLAEEACGILQADIAIIRVVDPAQQSLTVQAAHGASRPLRATLRAVATSVTPALRAGKPGSATAIDLTANPQPGVLAPSERQQFQTLGAAHALIVPLHHRGQFVGRLDLLRPNTRGFSPDECTAASVLGALLASAVDGLGAQPGGYTDDARMIAETFAFQQSFEQLSSVGELLQSIVEWICEAIDCDRCYALLREGGQEDLSPVAVCRVTPDLLKAVKELDEPPVVLPAIARAMADNRVLLVRDAQQSDLLSDSFVQKLGISSAILLPLRGRDNALLGVILLDCVHPECRFSERDLNILEHIAPHATVMVQNALLHQAVKLSSDSLALVNEIGISLASLTDIDGLFAQVFHHVSSVIDATRFCMGLLLPDGQALEFRSAVDNQIVGKPVVYPIGDDPLSRVVQTQRPIMINARPSDDHSPWFPPDPQLPPTQSMLAVPLLVGRRVIGVLAAQSEIRGAYAEHHRDLFATVGMQMGVAIENTRLYSMLQERDERRGYMLDHVLSRQEAERKMLVDDIHNHTLQTLAGCLFRIDTTVNQITELNVEDVRDGLEKIRDNLAENIDRLRQLIFQIRPSTLDILGLEPALREYLKHVERSTNIQTTLDVEISQRLPSDLETMIYRIVQEAIGTAHLRPGVSRIVIFIRERGNTVVLTIADNGRGVDEATLHGPLPADADVPDAQIDLMTLKVRTELAGGEVRLASRAGGGSTMQITLPCRGAL